MNAAWHPVDHAASRNFANRHAGGKRASRFKILMPSHLNISFRAGP